MRPVERDMGISIWNTLKGWAASVSLGGGDTDINERYPDPEGALDEAMKLYEKLIEAAAIEHCPTCAGSGLGLYDGTTCDTCYGTGANPYPKETE